MNEPVILVKKYLDPPTKKRRKFTWQLRWYDVECHRHAKTVAKGSDPMGKRKADHELRAKRREVEETGGRVMGKKPFNEFVEEHLATVKPTIRHTTYKIIEQALQLFDNTVRPGNVQDVDFAMAERFIKTVSLGRRQATINKYIGTLKRVFELAEARGTVKSNPFKRIRRGKAEKRDRQWFKPADFAQILQKAPSDFWRLLYYLAYTTGLRLGEMEHLRWEDLSFDAGILTVQEHLGGKLEIPWKPKDTDKRTVPLTKAAAEMLQRRRQEEVQLSSPYVFVSGDKARQLAKTWKPGQRLLNNVARTLTTVLGKAKIEKGCFHDFRVSAICNWLKAGRPAPEVQAMAGHADIKTTMEHYALVDDSAIEEAREVLEKIDQMIVAG